MRCVQTVEPLAAALGVEVEEREELVEEETVRGGSPQPAQRAEGYDPALCGRGDVVKLLFDRPRLRAQKLRTRVLGTTGTASSRASTSPARRLGSSTLICKQLERNPFAQARAAADGHRCQR